MKKYIKPTSPQKATTSQPNRNNPSKPKNKKKETSTSIGGVKQKIYKSHTHLTANTVSPKQQKKL